MSKTASVLYLLGKVQFKAKMYSGAADSFRQSIELMVRKEVQTDSTLKL